MMAGFPVVIVSSGGLPVTEVENGTPYEIADNGYGVPVTFVSSGGLPLTAGVSFSLDAFMAAQADGYTFDFTATDRLFQESTGPTPADAAGEVIGLALEDRLWGGQTLAQLLAAATELAPNTSFDTAASCTRTLGNATLSATGGRLRFTSTDTAASRWSMPVTCVVGSTYRLSAKRFSAGGPNANVSVSANASLSGAVAFVSVAAVDDTVDLFFVATATTMYVGGEQATPSTSGLISEWDDFTVKEVPGKRGIQATLNYRGKFQSTGKKYDGSDDFDSTPYTLSGATNVFAFDYADIPATIAATQVLFGAQNAGGEAFYLGVTTAGALRLKIGTTTIDSTSVDIRGGQHSVGAYTNGTTAYLMVDGVVVGSGTYSGSLPTTAWYLGAVNNNGISAAFFGGSLLFPLTGRDAITESRARQICTSLANAA